MNKYGAAAFGVLLALLSVVPTASAAPYTARLCTTEPTMSDHHDPWDTHDGSAWQLVNNCPSPGFTLSMVAPATPFDNPARYTLGLIDGVESLSFRVTGDDGVWAGVRQSIRVCDLSGVICGRPHSAATGERVVLRADTPDFPPYSARMLVITAACERAPECDLTGETVFGDLEISGDDEQPPELKLNPEPDGWINERTVLLMEPVDEESGAHYLRVPGLIDDYETGCADLEAHVFAFDCHPNELPAVEIEPQSFGQGVHRYTAEVIDAAGNRSERSFEIKVDSIAPPNPNQLAVTGERNGWVSDPELELRWQNSGETVADDGASGLATAEIASRRSGDDRFGNIKSVELSSGEYDRARLALPGDGLWEVGVALTDHAGNEGDQSLLEIGIDSRPPAAPAIESLPPVGFERASHGIEIGWLGLAGGISGVCGHTWRLDAAAASQPSDDLEDAIEGSSGHVPVTAEDLAALPDGRHNLHLRTFSCAGVPGAVAHRALVLDRLAPVVNATPRDGWITSAEPAVLTAVETESDVVTSGVESIEYSVDGLATTLLSGAKAELGLSAGMHKVAARAIDRAGNRGAWSEFLIGRDQREPSISIASSDPARPTHVRAWARDDESGIVESWIDIRPYAGGEWRRLQERPAQEPVVGGQYAVDAEIPDDGTLRNGRYVMRAVARDAAGHISITSLRQDGSAAAFELPLRSPSRLVVTREGDEMQGSPTLLLDYDDRVKLEGRLLAADGAPLTGRRIELVERRQGAVTQVLRELTSDGAGRVRLALPAGVSRRVELRFAGDALWGGAVAGLELRPRARLRLISDRKVVRGRGLLRLRGRLDISRAALPPSVMFVTISPLGVSDRNQIQRVPVASDGSFTAAIQYSARRARVRLRYRARVGSAAGWPFAPASSNVVKVVLRP